MQKKCLLFLFIAHGIGRVRAVDPYERQNTAAAEAVRVLLPFPRCRETVSVLPCSNFSCAVSCTYIFAAYSLNSSPFLVRQLAHPGALPSVLKPSPGHVAALSSAAGTKCCSARGGLSGPQASLAARYACKGDAIAQILKNVWEHFW